MKKCLFIDCCIRREESRTLQLAYNNAKVASQIAVEYAKLVEADK